MDQSTEWESDWSFPFGLPTTLIAESMSATELRKLTNSGNEVLRLRQQIISSGNYGLLTKPIRDLLACRRGELAPKTGLEYLWANLRTLKWFHILNLILQEGCNHDPELSAAKFLHPSLWPGSIWALRAGKENIDPFVAAILTPFTAGQLYQFAHAMQVIRGRLPGLPFALIRLVHTLAAQGGDHRARQWLEEQKQLGNSIISYDWNFFVCDGVDDIDPESFSRAHATGWYYRDSPSEADEWNR